MATLWPSLAMWLALGLVGVPLVVLLFGARPLDEQQWIAVPFVALGTFALVLQNALYADITATAATVGVWCAAVLAWVVLLVSRKGRAALSRPPLAPVVLTAAVFGAHGLGLWVLGADRYMGRAWSDQYNYVAMAQFLMDFPFSTGIEAVRDAPYLALVVSNLKEQRIAQSALQAFFAVTARDDAQRLFEPTILLLPALSVLAVWMLAKKTGFSAIATATIALTAGMLPALTWLHLSSFLSHALAIPLLLFLVAAVDELLTGRNVGNVVVVGLTIAAGLAIYPEFTLLFVALPGLMLAASAVLWRDGWRNLPLVLPLGLLAALLNPLYLPRMAPIVGGIGGSVLVGLFPWAYDVEGLARVWVGDLVQVPWAGVRFVLIVCGAAAFVLASLGLVLDLAHQLRPAALRARDQAALRAVPLGLAIVLLAALPWLLLLVSRDTPYQFYKLLLTSTPLLPLGIAMLGRALWLATSGRKGARTRCRVRLPLGAAVTAIMLPFATAAIVSSVTMLWRSTSTTPSPYNAYHHTDGSLAAVKDALAALAPAPVAIVEPDFYLNSWLSYFARRGPVWLSNPRIVDVDLSAQPIRWAALEHCAAPADVVVVSRRAAEAQGEAADGAEVLWSDGRYQLMRLARPPPCVVSASTEH